jgi:hypothetical protein
VTSFTPLTLRWAAWLALVYAVVILANATVGQVLTGWEDAKDYPRGLIRAGGFVLIGIGLLRRAKWAWWFGVGMSSFLLLMGLFAVGALLVLHTPETTTSVPPLFLPVAMLTTGLLVAIIILLLHPRTRAAFREAAV